MMKIIKKRKTKGEREIGNGTSCVNSSSHCITLSGRLNVMIKEKLYLEGLKGGGRPKNDGRDREEYV